MAVTPNRICVLIVHMGRLPGWFELWKHTAQRNPTVDFLVIQDSLPTARDGNVVLLSMTLEQINNLPTMRQEGLRCTHPYKLCDLKPLYAFVFPDLVAPYDYWGWGDLDVLYGRLNAFLDASCGEYDYISTGWEGESGPLAFIRNNDLLNTMWRQVEGIHEIVCSSESFAVDEKQMVAMFKQYSSCDIVFRECLHDLPARWHDGRLVSLASGKEYGLYHFGSYLKGTQPQINRVVDSLLHEARTGGSFEILKSHRLVPGTPNQLVRFWHWIEPVLAKSQARIFGRHA